MDRKEELAVLCTEASAEATQDSKGNPTVTVKAVQKDGRNETRYRNHMTEEAAQALLSDLLRVLEPAKPRYDARVVFADGQSAEFTNVAVQRYGDRYHFTETGRRHVWIERRDLSYTELEPHRPE